MIKTRLLLANLLVWILLAACGGAPALVATVDAAAIHTAAAATVLAGIALTPSATPTATPVPTPTPTAAAPAPETALAPTPEIISPPPMAEAPALAVYPSAGIRVLEKPVGVVRDGILVSVDQVVVYPERVELLYTVRDIPHAALFEPLTDDVALSCGGWDSYASLALPDGQVIPAVDYLLDGKAYDTITGPYARVFSVHLFRVAIPAGVTDLKMTLSCIGLARLDRAPLNWEIPFRLVP